MGIRGPIRYFAQKLNRIKETKKIHRLSNETPISIAHSYNIFPSFETPRVSIIIVSHDNEIRTKNCLFSIAKNLPKISFEVILIDDNCIEPLDISEINNIHVIQNKTRLGLLKSLNVGIKHTNSEYIFLLDSNTIVLKGFLDELFEVFENNNNIGAVGSVILKPDGSLKEAGSLFLKDFKKFQIVDLPTYYPDVNYVYQVDCCSFNSLLIKRISHEGDINFIDETCTESFYKEALFCLKLKLDQGKDIHISPFSKVISFNKENNIESANNILDHLNFKPEWKSYLSKIQAQVSRKRFAELYNNKSIVFFHDRVPEYDRYSGDLRLTEIIKTYKNLGYQIILVTPKNKINNPYNIYFQKLGICVFYEHKLLNELNDFFDRLNHTATVAWLSTASIFAKYYKVVKAHWPKAKLVFDMVDIHHLRFKRALEHDPNNKLFQNEYKRNLILEKKASQKAEITIPISQQEADYMNHFSSPKKMIVISNIHYSKVKLSEIPKFEDREGLFFIGSLHHPNIDAVEFLIEEIMPEIWKSLPEVKLHIVGNLNKVMKEIEHPNIQFYGHVPDVSKHFLKHKMMVAPLRSGAGVKGKIGQALEYYLPVITSTIGAEGMRLIDGENALLAENARQFADKIIKLYTHKELWTHLSSNSENSLQPFSIETLFSRIHEIENT